MEGFQRTAEGAKTDNLMQAERSALRDIQERDDIIIKPADKGSAVVVMDKTTLVTSVVFSGIVKFSIFFK
jgi:hypothetical protein